MGFTTHLFIRHNSTEIKYFQQKIPNFYKSYRPNALNSRSIMVA